MEEAFVRGWENFIGRWSGPMSLRFLMQPTVAILFAIRAGLKDARQHDPPFLRAMLSSRVSRQQWLRQAFQDVGKVFVVALILDSIYQILVHAGIYTLELLITATVLALIPYTVSRSLVTWIARWSGVGKQSVHSTTNDKPSDR